MEGREGTRVAHGMWSVCVGCRVPSPRVAPALSGGFLVSRTGKVMPLDAALHRDRFWPRNFQPQSFTGNKTQGKAAAESGQDGG